MVFMLPGRIDNAPDICKLPIHSN